MGLPFLNQSPDIFPLFSCFPGRCEFLVLPRTTLHLIAFIYYSLSRREIEA